VTGTTLLLALLLSGPGAAPVAASPPRAAKPPAAGERVELDLRFPPWLFTGTFTLVAGPLRDAGTARDAGSLVGPERKVVRVLEGANGTLTLTLRPELLGAFFPPIFGHWRVIGGTGAWAGWSGEGTFTSSDAGAAEGGSPFERQLLLGRLVPPAR
jgi:hypothetical protein